MNTPQARASATKPPARTGPTWPRATHTHAPSGTAIRTQEASATNRTYEALASELNHKPLMPFYDDAARQPLRHVVDLDCVGIVAEVRVQPRNNHAALTQRVQVGNPWGAELGTEDQSDVTPLKISQRSQVLFQRTTRWRGGDNTGNESPKVSIRSLGTDHSRTTPSTLSWQGWRRLKQRRRHRSRVLEKSELRCSHTMRAYSFLTSLLLAGLCMGQDLVVQTKSDLVPPAIKGLGVYERIGKENVFRLRLRQGMTVAQAKKRLKLVREVADVFPGDVERVNPANLRSVDRYIDFVRATAGGDEDGKRNGREEEPSEIWEAIRHRLQDRVDSRGLYHPEYLEKALAQKVQMEAMQGFRPKLPSGNWEFIGPKNLKTTSPNRIYMGFGPLAGRVNATAIDPVLNWYVGSAGGGVWRPGVNGVPWVPLSDRWDLMNISCVATGFPGVVYVGLGDFQSYGLYARGIMKSTNGGTTWTNLATTSFGGAVVSGIVVDPEDQLKVTVTTGRGSKSGHGSIYQSSDGGTTWVKKGVPDADWCGIDVSTYHPTDQPRKYIYWAVGSGGQVYKSADHGATWVSAGAPVMADCVSAAVSASSMVYGTCYILEAKQGAIRILKTIDGGDTWTNITGALATQGYNNSQGFYDYSIRAVHYRRFVNGAYVDGETLYVGMITITASKDEGVTWLDVGQTYQYGLKNHNDQHDIARFPTDPDGLSGVYGNDGGVYTHFLNPTTMVDTVTNRNSGLGISQIYGIAVDPDFADNVLSGAQDNGGPASLGDLNTWSNVGGGDSGSPGINPRNPAHQFLFAHGPFLYYTPDNWATKSNLLNPSPFGNEPASFIMPFVTGTRNDDILTATNFFYVYKNGWNGHASAQQIANPHNGVPNFVRCIATTQTDLNRIYTGANDGEMWTSPDYGANWTEIDKGASPLPARNVVAISPSPLLSTDVLVGLSGFLGHHLYRCANINATNGTRVWTSMDGTGATGLPDVPINAVCRDPYDPTHVWYVGTDFGVFMTNNSGATWINQGLTTGLPNVPVTDLQVQTKDRKLYAATFGRGIWRAPLTAPNLVGIKAIVVPPAVVGGQQIPFKVDLTEAAPYGGVKVALTSDNPLVTVPATLAIPGYSGSRSLVLTSPTVTAQSPVNLTGILNRTLANASVILSPTVKSLTMPASVVGGMPIPGFVNMYGITALDTTVKVTASLASPVNVTVYKGFSSWNYQQPTQSVLVNTNLAVTATLLSITRTSMIVLLPPTLKTLDFNNYVVVGPAPVTASLTIDVGAPAGMKATLASSDTSVATVPATVTFAKDSKTATFTISTKAQTQSKFATISATFNGKKLESSVTVTIPP